MNDLLLLSVILYLSGCVLSVGSGLFSFKSLLVNGFIQFLRNPHHVDITVLLRPCNKLASNLGYMVSRAPILLMLLTSK